MFELQFAVQYLKSASADFRFGNGEVFSSDDGTLVSKQSVRHLRYDLY